MSTNEDKSKKRAVVFEEGTRFRAVASWRPHPDGYPVLDTIVVEMLGVDALGAPRWESFGFAVTLGSASQDHWLGHMLIARAERWLKENT